MDADLSLPQNEQEAREVIAVEVKAIVLRNFREVNGKTQLNATAIGQEVADLFAKSYRLLQSKKENK